MRTARCEVSQPGEDYPLSYMIVKNGDTAQLEEKVSYYQARGWRLYGPPLAYSVTCQENTHTWQEFEFAQAMERDLS
jgi:hypothetical protein